MLNIGNPSNIVALATVEFPGPAEDVLILDSRIYGVAFTNGLLVYTNFTSPSLCTNFFAGVPIPGLCVQQCRSGGRRGERSVFGPVRAL